MGSDSELEYGVPNYEASLFSNVLDRCHVHDPKSQPKQCGKRCPHISPLILGNAGHLVLCQATLTKTNCLQNDYVHKCDKMMEYEYAHCKHGHVMHEMVKNARNISHIMASRGIPEIAKAKARITTVITAKHSRTCSKACRHKTLYSDSLTEMLPTSTIKMT